MFQSYGSDFPLHHRAPKHTRRRAPELLGLREIATNGSEFSALSEQAFHFWRRASHRAPPPKWKFPLLPDRGRASAPPRPQDFESLGGPSADGVTSQPKSSGSCLRPTRSLRQASTVEGCLSCFIQAPPYSLQRTLTACRLPCGPDRSILGTVLFGITRLGHVARPKTSHKESAAQQQHVARTQSQDR
jgi:hypothetical protein